jgi:hypothetical protein
VNEHIFFSICFIVLAAAQIVIALRRKERELMFLAAGWLVLAIVWVLRR